MVILKAVHAFACMGKMTAMNLVKVKATSNHEDIAGVKCDVNSIMAQKGRLSRVIPTDMR
jgi:hypothetical protein